LVKKDLDPYQLNFQYQEQGKVKNALVKVVLCERCKRKLTWKKDRERERKEEDEASRAREISPARHDLGLANQQQDGQDKRGYRDRGKDYERSSARA
jgi:protein FRA10AC1